MSNLFIEIRRPLAEQKFINDFIDSYQKGEILYKSKDYNNALYELRTAYNYLNDIWDEYPKICTLYLIMKSLFHIRNYGECLSLQEEIIGKIKLEKKRDLSKNKEKQEKFIKIQTKIEVYYLLINFICDNSGKSVECMLNIIKYLSQENTMTLEEKILYFWNYFKSFIQISGITKSNKFAIFKENYDSMIIIKKKEDENTINYSTIYECIYEPIKMINPTIIDHYKSLMNIKLKNQLYEILDREYYLYNFGIENDRVINFLHKNIHIYTQEKNKTKLLQLFNAFVVLGKIDLQKKFNMTMDEMIFVQKSRIEDWDIIFANLTGGFQHIFKEYIGHEKKLIFNKSLNDMKKIYLRPKSGLNDVKTYRGPKSINFSLSKTKEEIKKEIPITSFDYFNIDNSSIKIPENLEKIPKRNVFSELLNKKSKILKLKSNNFRRSKLIDFKLKFSKHSDLTFNKNIHKLNNYLSDRNSEKKNKVKFPHLINSTKSSFKSIKLNFSEVSVLNKNKIKKIFLNDKNNINQEIDKIKKRNIKNPEENKEKKKEVLRNINYTFMNILINIYTPIFKLENNLIPTSEKINYKKIFPRKIDLFMEPQLRNIIKSYYYKWSPGLILKENFNSFFYYENFLLVQNLIFMGICRSHSNPGQIISNELSILFPCYLLYIMIEDNLKHEKKDINKEIYMLSKTEENSKDFKDMFLLKYFLYKFNINLKYIPLLNDRISLLKNQANEAFHCSYKEIKNRHKIHSDISDPYILSCFFLNKIVYIFHLGYFGMLIGKYNDNFQEWEAKKIIEESDINEEKFKNYLSKKKNNNKKKKENITNMTNSETEKSQNNENNFEENIELGISKYKLEKNDKVMVIGSKGLFNNLSNEKIINSVGKFYNNSKNADEAASYLIELVKNKTNKSKKGNIYYETGQTNKKYEKEKERFLGFYNDLVCIVIFFE